MRRYRCRVAVTCVTWFPAAELDQALVLWPSMIDWDYTDHADYCRHLELQLRRMKAEGLDDLAVSPVRLQEYLSWCDETDVDPALAASRARYAAVVGLRGGAVEWPPSARARCWCGSGLRYSRCCGTAE